MAARYFLYPLWLAFVFAILELSLWGYFSFAYRPQAGSETDTELARLIEGIPPADLEKFRLGQYDPTLGWTNGADVAYDHEGHHYVTSKDRIRVNPYESDKVRISAYGDSFTFGDEVENNETFPYFLSTLTRTNVINYGVSAYGTDQALLRLKQNLENGKRTDIVVLEMIQDSIQRNMNMYLAFKYGFQDWTRYMFKPMLHDGPQGYEWVASPLDKLANTADVMRAYAASKPYDWFYRRPRPDISFPYTASAVQTIWHLGKQRFDGSPDWGHGPSERKMKELIRFYAALAEQYRFVPVLIYVPLGFEIKDFLAGDEQQRFSTFLAETAGEYQDSTMTVIDLAPELKAMGSKLHVKDFYVRPYDGHPSAYGNELIAEVIYERIEPLLADRAQTAQLLVH